VKHDRQPAPDREPFNKALGCTRAMLFFLPLVIALGRAAVHSRRPPVPQSNSQKFLRRRRVAAKEWTQSQDASPASHPGQQIVIYARSGPWWVQPWPDKPFIPIQAGLNMGNLPRISALSTPPCWWTPAITRLLRWTLHPRKAGRVVAVSIVKGTGATQLAPVKPLHFSGYDWEVRTIAGDRGGMNNLYGAENAWTDSSGALHLSITKKGDKWSVRGGGVEPQSRLRNLHRCGS